jgi:hypothetical protein
VECHQIKGHGFTYLKTNTQKLQFISYLTIIIWLIIIIQNLIALLKIENELNASEISSGIYYPMNKITLLKYNNFGKMQKPRENAKKYRHNN